MAECVLCGSADADLDHYREHHPLTAPRRGPTGVFAMGPEGRPYINHSPTTPTTTPQVKEASMPYAVQMTYAPTTGCIFRCTRQEAPTLGVELVVAPDGRFIGSTHDADGARRQPGIAHDECYAAFQAVVYGTA